MYYFYYIAKLKNLQENLEVLAVILYNITNEFLKSGLGYGK